MFRCKTGDWCPWFHFLAETGLSFGTQFFFQKYRTALLITMALLWLNILGFMLATGVDGVTEFGRIRSVGKEREWPPRSALYRPSIATHPAHLDLQRMLDG